LFVYIEHLKRRGDARISITRYIRDDFTEKLQQLAAHDPVTIDCSAYPDEATANEDIFGNICETKNLGGNDEIYSSPVINFFIL